jgi:carbamoyltransferase
MHLIEVTRWWLKDTGMGDLAVAGGVYGNVKLNQRLHAMDECENLFVYPNMGDGGLSLGAICLGERLRPRQVENVFLGEDYTEAAVQSAIEARGLAYERMDAPEDRVGDLLAQGHIVARFDGRMEWGPRALGNRSILVRTSDRAVVDKLNDLLKRSDFMPFAPAVLAEDAEEYCLGVDPARHSAEFMTVCFDCTQRMKDEHPAIVHVDGTARAQLVREDHNPTFHRILTRFKQHTGTGVVLNTSFNIHEEPIVRTPEEGVAAFLNARLDYLAIGPFLVKQPEEL